MAFFENNCPNGQFKYAILAGEYAVNLPIQARSEILDDFRWLAELPGNSLTWRQKCPMAQPKFSR
jgi:hypothetical protein